MSKMENSIFDEFDLRMEADFTSRGRAMMKQFTDEHSDNGVRTTTPVGSLISFGRRLVKNTWIFS